MDLLLAITYCCCCIESASQKPFCARSLTIGGEIELVKRRILATWYYIGIRRRAHFRQQYIFFVPPLHPMVANFMGWDLVNTCFDCRRPWGAPSSVAPSARISYHCRRKYNTRLNLNLNTTQSFNYSVQKWYVETSLPIRRRIDQNKTKNAAGRSVGLLRGPQNQDKN